MHETNLHRQEKERVKMASFMGNIRRHQPRCTRHIYKKRKHYETRLPVSEAMSQDTSQEACHRSAQRGNSLRQALQLTDNVMCHKQVGKRQICKYRNSFDKKQFKKRSQAMSQDIGHNVWGTSQLMSQNINLVAQGNSPNSDRDHDNTEAILMCDTC